MVSLHATWETMVWEHVLVVEKELPNQKKRIRFHIAITKFLAQDRQQMMGNIQRAERMLFTFMAGVRRVSAKFQDSPKFQDWPEASLRSWRHRVC